MHGDHKKIINMMMGGTIHGKSEEGRGMEFIVVLDCKLSNHVVTYEPILEWQGACTLVTYDDTNTCMSDIRMLRQIGMRAGWTVSSKKAIVRAKEAYVEGDEFKAYIIDWLISDMNGMETVHRIRKLIVESSSIIILTAYDWSEIELEAREEGFMDAKDGDIG